MRNYFWKKKLVKIHDLSIFSRFKKKIERNERETKNFEKYEVQSVDKGTDPMKILKEAKVQTYEEEKKPVEIIPTVPNEDVDFF